MTFGIRKVTLTFSVTCRVPLYSGGIIYIGRPSFWIFRVKDLSGLFIFVIGGFIIYLSIYLSSYLCLPSHISFYHGRLFVGFSNCDTKNAKAKEPKGHERERDRFYYFSTSRRHYIILLFRTGFFYRLLVPIVSSIYSSSFFQFNIYFQQFD